MTHRSRAFNVAIDQENTAAISRRGQTLQAKTPAPSSRTGLQDVKRLAQSTAGPQTRVLGKQGILNQSW